MESWDLRFPGTRKALDRLTALGFVEHQHAIIVDTRTGKPSIGRSKPVPRFRLTPKGRRLAATAAVDPRVLTDHFPRLTASQEPKIVALLQALHLEYPASKIGASTSFACQEAGIPERSARWWIRKLESAGYVTRLDQDVADVRDLIPEHWRITRTLCRQMEDIIEAFPAHAPPSLRVEFRLSRTRFLGDIDPARVGIDGATDFDHDIEAQAVLAALLRSPRAATTGVFSVEPRINLSVAQQTVPWTFTASGRGSVFYQPDAELRENSEAGALAARSVIEYERYQTRRDGWNHIEKFLGWVHLGALPFEEATLRFVVEGDSRTRSYVELIEAFADYAIDFPSRMPRNKCVLAVTSSERIRREADPLDPRCWFRITLPRPEGSETDGGPVLHSKDGSPYNDYFSRGWGADG